MGAPNDVKGKSMYGNKIIIGFRMFKTSQELRMLSSVTINCQVTKIVMNSGSQLSELGGVLKMSLSLYLSLSLSLSLYLSL